MNKIEDLCKKLADEVNSVRVRNAELAEENARLHRELLAAVPTKPEEVTIELPAYQRPMVIHCVPRTRDTKVDFELQSEEDAKFLAHFAKIAGGTAARVRNHYKRLFGGYLDK